MPAISMQRRSCSSPHWPRVWGLAQGLLQARGLGVEIADRLAHLLEQGARLQVTFAAFAHLRLDLFLALGDAFGKRLDLRLAFVEGRLGSLGVDLARLLVDPLQVRDRLRCGFLDRRPWIDRGGLLRRPCGNDVDKRGGERENGYGEDNRHPTMVTSPADGPGCRESR